jgi:hypothetical protein
MRVEAVGAPQSFGGGKIMSAKFSFVVTAVAVLLLGVLGVKSAQAQDAPASSLADQLKTQYKLAKMGSDSGGRSVVDAGTVLVIQKGGILGVPPGNVAMAPATYKDGDLHGPNGFAAGLVGHDTRQLTVNEKVYITKIDVRSKNDKIMLTIVECDSCNGVQQPSSYKSAVVFQFPKGYLDKADVSQVQGVIGQVLAPDTSSPDQAQNQPQSAPDQPSSAPRTIQLGQTIDQVQAALGQPDKIVDLGAKKIYVYKDLKVVFTDGKVVDVQ